MSDMFTQTNLSARCGHFAKGSTTKDRQDQAQQNADDDAGDDGKIKSGVLALDPDVARQTPEPFWSKSTPKHEAKQNGNCAENNQKFSHLTHRRIFFDKSRDGKSRVVGAGLGCAEESNSKSRDSAERRLTNLVWALPRASCAAQRMRRDSNNAGAVSRLL
jgi:hypothetical protein